MASHSARLAWEDGTTVVFWFVAKNDARCQVTVTHHKLATRGDAEARKAYWAERLGVLADLLRAEAELR